MIYIALYLFIGLLFPIYTYFNDKAGFILECNDIFCEFGKIGGTGIILLWLVLTVFFWPAVLLEPIFTDKRKT